MNIDILKNDKNRVNVLNYKKNLKKIKLKEKSYYNIKTLNNKRTENKFYINTYKNDAKNILEEYYKYSDLIENNKLYIEFIQENYKNTIQDKQKEQESEFKKIEIKMYNLKKFNTSKKKNLNDLQNIIKNYREEINVLRKERSLNDKIFFALEKELIKLKYDLIISIKRRRDLNKNKQHQINCLDILNKKIQNLNKNKNQMYKNNIIEAINLLPIKNFLNNMMRSKFPNGNKREIYNKRLMSMTIFDNFSKNKNINFYRKKTVSNKAIISFKNNLKDKNIYLGENLNIEKNTNLTNEIDENKIMKIINYNNYNRNSENTRKKDIVRYLIKIFPEFCHQFNSFENDLILDNSNYLEKINEYKNKIYESKILIENYLNKKKFDSKENIFKTESKIEKKKELIRSKKEYLKNLKKEKNLLKNKFERVSNSIHIVTNELKLNQTNYSYIQKYVNLINYVYNKINVFSKDKHNIKKVYSVSQIPQNMKDFNLYSLKGKEKDYNELRKDLFKLYN